MFREHAGESTDRASKFRFEVMGRAFRDLDCGADSCGPYRSMHNIIQEVFRIFRRNHARTDYISGAKAFLLAITHLLSWYETTFLAASMRNES